MIVYLDGVMGLNFLIDWFLLLGVNRLSGYPPGAARAAAGAAFGSGYAGLCLIPGFSFLASALWRTVSLGVISLTAFGASRSAFSRGMLFTLLSMSLGGLALCTNAGTFWELILGACGLALLCGLGFGGRNPGTKLIPVKLEHRGTKAAFYALRDTGNTLTDPVTGEPVLVADAQIARKLLGLEEDQLRDPVRTMTGAGMDGLRLIPFKTVGSDGGFLLGVRCDRVELQGRQSRRLVAFSPEDFSGGGYDGLIGGV